MLRFEGTLCCKVKNSRFSELYEKKKRSGTCSSFYGFPLLMAGPILHHRKNVAHPVILKYKLSALSTINRQKATFDVAM